MPAASLWTFSILFLPLSLTGCGTKADDAKDVRCTVDPATVLPSDVSDPQDVCDAVLAKIDRAPLGTVIRVHGNAANKLIAQPRLGSGQMLPDVTVDVPQGANSQASVDALATEIDKAIRLSML